MLAGVLTPQTVLPNPALSKRHGLDGGCCRPRYPCRAVPAELASHDLVEFEAEFRCALAQPDGDFDLAPVQAVINGVWGRAHLRIHPPTAQEGGSAWT